MSRNFYIHTMDGSPAYFDKKEKRIFFINKFHNLKFEDVACCSLSTIKRQQEAERKSEIAAGPYRRSFTYSYIRIPAPKETL